ncbi:MAG: HAD family hydrolase [Defluviitaleaceae bacterium]|nr:HAD family hydrolase [Defluviitaleaceae bacterium]
MRKKHIIFDMDGTLAATATATALAIGEAKKKYNLPAVTDYQIRDAMGLGGLEFYTKLFPALPEETLKKIEPEIDDHEDASIQKIGRAILFPGVYEMLNDLFESGHSLYIASTGSSRHVQVTLDAAEIKTFFTDIHCGELQKIDMVKRIIAGRDTRDWIMVGDMYKDSEAAHGNNILALGAGYGYLAKEDIELFDRVLEKPGDITNYL